MKKILNFLAVDGAFLYEDCSCRIADSEFIPTFGGTGSITLRNDFLELKLWLDRDILFMDVRGVSSTDPASWFSVDILRQMLTGQVTDKAAMDHDNLSFLRARFADLQTRFDEKNLSATEESCRKLEIERSKRLFG